jgi:bifunctional DNA-binding transcriptional regulator/antitoxin component of YhaV-PrlF toxin-antitoxin module
MDLRISKVTENGFIVLPDEIKDNLGLSKDDSVALIYENNRVIMRKLTFGTGRMTFEEFIIFRDVIIKNSNHERVVRAFYIYLESVTGNCKLLPEIIGRLLDIDTSALTIKKGCFNGIFDGTVPPYDDVDFYVKLSNDICLFVYGKLPSKPLTELKNNEYVLFMLSDDINGKLERKENRYIYIT